MVAVPSDAVVGVSSGSCPSSSSSPSAAPPPLRVQLSAGGAYVTVLLRGTWLSISTSRSVPIRISTMLASTRAARPRA
jgi:hypothetical protein